MVADVIYVGDCDKCGIAMTVTAYRATRWQQEYDSPCGNCGRTLRMKIKAVR